MRFFIKERMNPVNRKQIMIVDDDVPIGDMLEEVLTREGYRVSRAYSGTEVLISPMISAHL